MEADLDLRIHKLGCAARVVKRVFGQPIAVLRENACDCRSQAWRDECAVIVRDGEIRVRHGDWALIQSHGPLQGHIWDVGGDDYHSLELAFLAVATAPPPPDVIANEFSRAHVRVCVYASRGSCRMNGRST